MKNGYFLLSALLVLLDQGVKTLIRARIPLHETVAFLPGFDLTHLRNTGAAFSILSAHTWILTLLSAVVSLALVAGLARRFLPSRTGMLAMALLLGGAVGNLIDRARFGYVTDMFRTTFMDFPVFNVADMAVVAGGALLCLYVILSYREEKREAKT